ncbi:MAG: hypothetical protein ABI616_03400 [Pseudomonadota bacterium]
MYKWIRTTALATLLLASTGAMAAAAAAPAAADLAGVWQGKLAVDPKNSLTIQFTFAKDAKGAYTAVLNSPDNGAIKNTPATGVTWDGSNVKLQVAALSGSYAGVLKDGKINGQWTQPGGALPLVLSPYQKPVMTKAAMDALNGDWLGTVTVGPSPVNTVFQFKKNDKGELVGTFGIPDQGLTDSPITDLEFDGTRLSLNVPRLRAGYAATLVPNQLNGMLKIAGPGVPPEGLPLNLKHGEYKAKVYPLKFSTEEFAALNGSWKGKLEITPPNGGQKVVLSMVLRFGTSDNGQYVGYIDSPDQKAMNIAITDASFKDGKLMVKVDAVKGEYNGTLAGKTITGTWMQGPINTPLVLTR